MRENFNLLTELGRANCRAGRGRWVWRWAVSDTWDAIVCLVRGHDFSDPHTGSPWCRRCHIATRPVRVRD